MSALTESLETPFNTPFFADGTMQLLQGLYHSHSEFFTQRAVTRPTTGAQAQYRQTKEDGMFEGDVQ